MKLKDKRILVIDDADPIRTFLRISIQSHQGIFYESDTAEKGLDLAEETNPDLVILDLGLPDRDGLEILPEIKARKKPPHVIILSVRKEREVKEKAKQLGADAYFTKPFMMEDLMDAIHEQLSA